ncbi:MAG: rhomboid family intramembrane serine protease [Planctomycetes bacterium]|nr:rhomboid family intramembrane serine protease [Planctomycetota bacterium]
MGIYDRDYYRAAPARFRMPSGGVPAWAWLIGINVAVFLVQTFMEGSGRGALVDALTLIPSRVIRNLEVWRLVTSAFLHGGAMHILFNMLFLWWMGRELERFYGRTDFLWFYLVSTVFASLIYVLTAYYILAPWRGAHFRTTPAIGASGAVLAVVTLFAFHFPRRRIYLWGILPIPIWLFVAILVWDDLHGFASSRPTGIAHGAHLGGVVIGAAFRFVDLRFSTIRRWIVRRGPRRVRDRDRIEPRERSMEEVDAILAKISRQGMSSLTPEERSTLLRASQNYRGR